MDEAGILNNYSDVKTCIYKGERYSVRNNGAIYRYARKGKRVRKDDNKWTFGKPNKRTGYMDFCSERVHRIVAFAFLGEPPTLQHVVDHIDTNRRNNRPQNLRWLTKLDNVLKNPITLKKIEYLCGSIDAFLNNPSIIGEFVNSDSNFEWMRTVTPEEAKASYKRLCEWVKRDNKKKYSDGRIGEWIYQERKVQPSYVMTDNNTLKNDKVETSLDMRKDLLVEALTPDALQRNWVTPTEFPCCPKAKVANPIMAYYSNLSVGHKFSCNQYGDSIVLDFAFLEKEMKLLVLCKNDKSLKPWSLAGVTYENEKFVHTSYGMFFSEDGAKKDFTLVQGKEWTGGTTFDDLCN